MPTRAVYRSHIGRALGRDYYVSSTTTAASANAKEIVDSARTEHDDHWNGATARISSQDRPVLGGSGVDTNRSPIIYLDRALSGTPAISTNYELLKTWTFTDVDESIDDALANMYPYFYDPIDDITTIVEAANDIEYDLPATWKEVFAIERQIPNSNPVRYTRLARTVDYDIREAAASNIIILRYLPLVGRALRVFAKAIPSLGTTDASTSIHPWQVVVPGALHFLYAKGGNPDAGSLTQRWQQESARNLAIFEKRKQEFHMNRPATDLAYPIFSP